MKNIVQKRAPTQVNSTKKDPATTRIFVPHHKQRRHTFYLHMENWHANVSRDGSCCHAPPWHDKESRASRTRAEELEEELDVSEARP
jgi:hypothetical protein